MTGRTWKAWLVPGGLLLALVAAIVNSSLFVQIAPSLSFYYVGIFAGGLLLAWRFNSSRVLFSLLVLLLTHRAVNFFSTGQIRTGPGRTAVALAALLIPLNFIVFAAMLERGLTIAGIAPRFGLLFLESVVFAVLCRPENSPANSHPSAPAIPFWILLSFAAAIAVFVRRFFQTRKPIEPGFVWSAAAVFLWLEFAPVGKMSDAYVATAALILAASLIETSYVLAYHDELTGIHGRRAFNESLLSLDQQYAIAIVDIDHFKTVQRHLRTRYRRSGPVHGGQAAIASRRQRPGLPLRRRRVRHSLSQHVRQRSIRASRHAPPDHREIHVSCARLGETSRESSGKKRRKQK